MRLARADARGRLLDVRTLSAPATHSIVSALATSRRPGEALVAYNESHEGAAPDESRVMAARIAPDGTFAGSEAISDYAVTAAPAAAFDPRTGAAIVVWLARVGARRGGEALDPIALFASGRPAG